MKKWLEEIERIKQEQNPMLNRKCIGIDNCSVIFLDNFERINLSNSYFEEAHSIFDPTWAGCYIVPGQICTVREIHINALKCDAISHIIDDWYRYGYYKPTCEYIPEDFIEKCNQFGLKILTK